MNIEKSITGLTIETVEMTEVDGMGQGAVLQFMLLPKGSSGHQEKEIRTCLGDIYVIVNALRIFESAGVIESRSSGMKGTSIKVLNDAIYEEIASLKARMDNR